MPKRLLRMVLVTFSLVRQIYVNGRYSDEVDTISAIVPGSVFAVAALHCMFFYPCDHIVSNWGPALSLAKFVDDVTVPAKGLSGEVGAVALETRRRRQADWKFGGYCQTLGAHALAHHEAVARKSESELRFCTDRLYS